MDVLFFIIARGAREWSFRIMTFTLLSVVIFLALVFGIFGGVLKGFGRGFVRSVFSLVSVVFSLIVGGLVSSYLISGRVSGIILGILTEEGVMDSIPAEIMNFEEIILAVAAMILSSVIFLFVFGMISLLCRITVAILYKTVLRPHPDDVGYVEEGAPWYRRYSKTLGGVVGGICSFLICVTVLSPIIGTLKTADTVVDILYEVDVLKEGESFEGVDILKEYADDVSVNVLYYSGGKIVYDLSARSRINGKTVILSREVRAVGSVIGEFMELGPTLSNLAEFDGEDVERMEGMCEKIEDSYFISVVCAEFLSGASSSWARDEEFFGMQRPGFDSIIDPIFDSILGVFAGTDAQTVGADLRTLLRVTSIITESGILDATGDYTSLMSLLEDGTFIDDITKELNKNPRMSIVTDNLYQLAMRMVVKEMNSIKLSELGLSDYDKLINDLTDQLNLTGGLDGEMQKEQLKNYAVDYFGDYGMDVPDSVADMIIGEMVDQVKPEEDGIITSDQLKDFFDQYVTE